MEGQVPTEVARAHAHPHVDAEMHGHAYTRDLGLRTGWYAHRTQYRYCLSYLVLLAVRVPHLCVVQQLKRLEANEARMKRE